MSNTGLWRKSPAIALGIGLWLTATAATAQTTGTIAGVVRDASGGVIPGVTVEASSPALIEKVRAAVTDGSGQYRIADLRPGTYAVTIALAGFTTVRNEGLAVSAGFTATINAELRVSALNETITVTGLNPQVDIQNTRQQTTVTKDLLDSLPSARTYQAVSQLTPGSRGPVEVGGSSMDRAVGLTIHGSDPRDQALVYDGLQPSNMNSAPGSAYGIWVNDTATVQEYSVQAGAQSAEIDVSGFYTNVIPKEGGNTFAGSIFANYTDGQRFQSGNLTAAIRARGLTAVDTVDKIWEVAPTMGGPIKKDKLWFFASFMSRGSNLRPPNTYYEKDPTDHVFEQDLSRPAINALHTNAESFRVTLKATDKFKIGFFADIQQRCCFLGITPNFTPESASSFKTNPNAMYMSTFSAPLTNRWLVDGGLGVHPEGWTVGIHPDVKGEPYSIFEQTTGITYQATGIIVNEQTFQWNTKWNVSYVTGSHALKFGLRTMNGSRDDGFTANRDGNITTFNNVPVSLRVYTTPYNVKDELKYHIGLFGQEQWTLRRATINLGLRLDAVNARLVDYTAPGGTYIGPRSFKARGDLPSWRDISPRLGISYDLFGTGRTAVKATLGRFVTAMSTGIAFANNPLQTSVNAASRAWTDANRDFVPQESELGPATPSSFGNPVVNTTYAPDLLTGSGRRGFNWEGDLEVEHQLMTGVSVSATYVRRSFGNYIGGMNTLVGPGDYDPYCVTVPVDTRLPGGGGNQLCGFYDIKPAKFGQQNIVVNRSSELGGDQHKVYNGFDLTTNMRLENGVTLQGGISSGRNVIDFCDIVKATGMNTYGGGTVSGMTLFMAYRGSGAPGLSGPTQYGCHDEAPFLLDMKLLTVVPLPWWGVKVSATFLSVPGGAGGFGLDAQRADFVTRRTFTVDEIQASLGRPLSGGVRTVTVPIVTPESMFLDRVNQVDLQVGKQVKLGRVILRPTMDVHNLLNASPVLSVNTTYGALWLRPLSVMQGRLFKLGTKIEF